MAGEDNTTPVKQKRRRYPLIVTLANSARRDTYDNDKDRIWRAWNLHLHWGVFWFFWESLPSQDPLCAPLFATQECICDGSTSLVNALTGHYKASLWALRSMLELTLTAILFHRDPSQLQKYDAIDKTPPWSSQLLKVLDYDCFADYRRFFRQRHMRKLANWAHKKKVNKLYHRVLSRASHSHIERWSYLDWDRFFVPEYSSALFREWYRIFKAVNERCLLFLYLAFPRAYHYALAEYDQPFDDLFSFWQRRYLTIRHGSTQ